MNEVMARYLQEELAKQSILQRAQIFVYRGGHWIDCRDNKPVENHETSTALSSRQGTEKHRKLFNPPRAVVWDKKESVAILLDITKKSRLATLDGFHERLKECIGQATNSYFANHDHLTGILNRHGIQWELERSATDDYRSGDEPSGEEQQPDHGEVALFAFDIDRFKSVNDTYGHDVGDAVLAMFAERVSSLVPALAHEYGMTCIFGRPGGEEFELIAIKRGGRVPDSVIADRLLECIRSPKLPSEEDLKKFAKKHSSSALFGSKRELPNAVTASIGSARRELTKFSASNIEETYAKLRNNADTACYRAKDDGRDCWRAYEDLRMHHGRVFEFHQESGLAVIDIGRAVGVKAGDVFRVFYPPFLKNQTIFLKDDRSSKPMGEYPCVESARLMVFDQQEQVSTCVVLEKQTSEPIPKGARLEYVNRGSMPQFHSRPRQKCLGLETSPSVLEYIGQLLKDETIHSVIRLNGKFPSEDQRTRDEKLSTMVSAIKLAFPPKTKIFGAAHHGLYVVLQKAESAELFELDVVENASEAEAVSLVSQKQEQIQEMLGRLTPFAEKLKAGVFFPELTPPGAVISPESIAFFCSAALFAAEPEKEPLPNISITFFDSKTPKDVLYKWRMKRMIDDVLADYQSFKDYGLEATSMNNHFALTVLETNSDAHLPLAELALSKALTIDPNADFLRANLGLVQARRGNHDGAHQQLGGVLAFVKKSSVGYALSLIKSSFELRKKGAISDASLAKLVSEVAPKLNPPFRNPVYQSWWQDVRSIVRPDDGIDR